MEYEGRFFMQKTKNDDFDDATITHRDGYSLFIRTLALNTNFEGIKKRLKSFVDIFERTIKSELPN